MGRGNNKLIYPLIPTTKKSPNSGDNAPKAHKLAAPPNTWHRSIPPSRNVKLHNPPYHPLIRPLQSCRLPLHELIGAGPADRSLARQVWKVDMEAHAHMP